MTHEAHRYARRSEPGYLARIVGFDDARTTMYLLALHGAVLAIHADQEMRGSVGDIVHVTNNSYEVVPNEMWVEDTLVGVVRLKQSDATILDVGNQIIAVPTPEFPDYGVNFTVEATKSQGVVRVISNDPLPPLDRGAGSEDLLARVKQTDFSDTDDLNAIGGLVDVVREARRLILLPLKEPQRFERLGGNTIKGVLFTGPPGVGKTMMARALAREAGGAFYNIRGPELSSMWVGESERLLRKIFEDAGRERHSLIFFDDFDSIGGQRTERAHEASRHLVAQLLTLMDGFTRYENVVVIAATNRVEDVDTALRRPGRFDWELVFPSPREADRVDILTKSSNRIAVSGDLPYQLIASRTEGWTGADIVAIWREAVLLAADEDRSVVTAEDLVAGHHRAARHRAFRKQPQDVR